MQARADQDPHADPSLPRIALEAYAPLGLVMVAAIAGFGVVMARLGLGGEVPDLTAPAAFVALAPAATIGGRRFALLGGRAPNLREAGVFGVVATCLAGALAVAAAAVIAWFGGQAWLLGRWAPAVGGEAGSPEMTLAVFACTVVALMTAWSFWSTARRSPPQGPSDR